MKCIYYCLLFLSLQSTAQKQTCENIIIVTTDGYRWQELFSGADSAILFNNKYVNDTATMRAMYWAATSEERRKKLMPFTWNYISTRGQLWGNKDIGNCVSIANPYRFSYAGYNELLTGYSDRAMIANKPKKNINGNLLSFFNTLPEFRNKVAMFGSWNLFPFILNGTKEKIKLNAGIQKFEDDSVSNTTKIVNQVQDMFDDQQVQTRSDLLTFTLAMEYMHLKHPKIIHIGFGETDEYAHHGQYDKYLAQANQFDKFLADIWALIQSDPFYKNKTTLFITTDHGRGRTPGKWSVHGPLVGGSDETWMIQMGPHIEALGEVKERVLIQNEQFAQTLASYLGKVFISNHPVTEAPYTLIH